MHRQSGKGKELNREFGHFKYDELTHLVIGAAVEVHQELGPGMQSSTYEQCMVFELDQRHLRVRRQVLLPIRYKKTALPQRIRLNMVVEDRLLVDIKSVDKLRSMDEALVNASLKLANLSTGLLINFNVLDLRDGIKRFMSGGD